MPREGWKGWDEYAPFYDWENARTLGRRDVPFWRTLALRHDGPVLELGCGTGRISIPLAKAGVSLVGIDRSDAMLARARQRIRRGRLTPRARLLRGELYLSFWSGTNTCLTCKKFYLLLPPSMLLFHQPIHMAIM